MRWPQFLSEPLQGNVSLTRVFWLYGVVGSLAYGALELLLDSGNAIVMHLYIVGGLVISAYTAVATYRCAGNCRSRMWTRMAQVSAILSLLLLPLLAYLQFSGALDQLMSDVL
jgi:hypothetical protein